jgi:hypothetical protein
MGRPERLFANLNGPLVHSVGSGHSCRCHEACRRGC